MADKKLNSVLETNIDVRNQTLQNNRGKYESYNKELNVIVGKTYNVYENEKNPTIFTQHPDLIRYTHAGKTDYSKDLQESYGLNSEDLMYYGHNDIKPRYRVNDYDGFKDYMTYIFDTYGREESYAGHLTGLLGVRELAENLAYDLAPNFRGKTAQDVINEILQYTDIQYALEGDKVGVVRDLNVGMALAGQVTTNINNYTGKETRMGLITNQMYAKTLLHAANFNSLRRTKYITPELEKLYGNNLSNVYSLSSLFRVNNDNGRIPDPVTDDYIKILPNGNIYDYLPSVIPNFQLPNTGYDWSTHANYGVDNLYFGVSKEQDYSDYIIPDDNDWTIRHADRQINKGIINDSYRVYSEGPEKGQGGWALNEQDNTLDGFLAAPIIELEKETLLKKTNDLLSSRRAKTIISRFYDNDNKERNVTQSAVYENFGVSHGRNLLTKEAYEKGEATSSVSGYKNPYCRVWTNHYQYSKMKNLIRPFITDGAFTTIEELQKSWTMFRAKDAAQRLSQNTSLNKNGMVNITPTKGSGDDKVDIKQCMFSIENLAWKDVLTSNKGVYRRYENTLDKNGNRTYTEVTDRDAVLSEEQRGPNGGRIMWFPPYDVTFQETASAKWSENEFIGRGEPVYTYVNSNRAGTLEFTLLVDHPSVINYWLMDKENTEENEQALLRYFAGCEILEPTEDVVERILDAETNPPGKDPVEVPEERDIIFYTFFPNNYSGVDAASPEDAMDILFGGMGKDKKYVEEKLFLGYEMGVNPMSVNSITYEEGEGHTFYLDNIYHRGAAEKKFAELKEFENADILDLSLDEILAIDIKEDETTHVNVCECNIKNYETIYNSYFKANDVALNTEQRLGELDEEIASFEAKIMETQEEIDVIDSELSEVEENSMAYYAMVQEISNLNFRINALETGLLNKRNEKDRLIENDEDNFDKQQELLDKIEEIEDKFVPTQEYNKTNPIFIFSDYDLMETNPRFGILKCDTAAEAFARYRESNLKTFFTNSSSEKPYNFLLEKNEVACRTKYGGNDTDIKYWIVTNTTGDSIPYIIFDNKRKFTKGEFDFGKTSDGKQYFVKFGGQTYEFKGENPRDKANEFVTSHYIIPEFESEEEFLKSSKLYGYKMNGRIPTYFYYDFIAATKEEIVTKITESLNAESGEKGDEYIIEKYYENHKYGCVSDFGYGKNYGVIQYFFTAKRQEKGESYATVQDFIARHDFQKNDIGEVKDDTNYIASGVTTSVSISNENVQGIVNGTIQWDLLNPTLSYPVDKGKDKENIDNKNYYDMKSFGLNSTLEVVRKEMGDRNITFSFGEVYAALHGEEEKAFVLSCERGVLKSVLNLEGEELEEKVKEAEERIEYLKKVFNPQDGTTNLKVTDVQTLGTASSHGNKEKNVALSNNREDTIKGYLKTLPVMKDIDMSKVDPDKRSTNNIIGVDENNPKDINDISAKKGRHTRVTIVVGDKDLTVEQIEDIKSAAAQREEDLQNRLKLKYKRYDNERLFFSMLKENDSIAYKRLVDKVKYFSPAFHSITPEGFNSRLTFLHQCTRQGPTSSVSQSETGGTASNLAFGRAPYCVLRLGDFLNTKIIIDSVNITYPDSMWDLNPDGIGVQFMMAKISMQIKIIGGSDISAPIKRLQNAVSFNYYANTSIYDDRSDTAQYDEVAKISIDKTHWFPNTNI